MKKHYLPVLLILFYVGDAAALPDCPSSGYFDNCYGEWAFDNGDKYVGEWKDDKNHGQGTYSYAEGDKYVGEYKDGLRHGQGTYTYAGGTTERGYFSNNEFVPDICEGMGLTKGSDAFGNCVLKLMDD